MPVLDTIPPLYQHGGQTDVKESPVCVKRVSRRPLIRWILQGLQSAPGQWVDRQFFQNVLEWEFRPKEAEQQMEQAINWGRYGELLGYDDDQLYLETERNAG